MAREKDKKITGEMLSPREIEIIMAGGSPWLYTTAPKRPENELPKKKQAIVSV